ncbi:MAG: hypothetical protein ACM3QZ_09625 [Solirubrobacterales bacterium]
MSKIKSYRDQEDSGFHYEQLAIPWAFVNGLFLGGWLLRKGREYWENGPRD